MCSNSFSGQKQSMSFWTFVYLWCCRMQTTFAFKFTMLLCDQLCKLKVEWRTFLWYFGRTIKLDVKVLMFWQAGTRSSRNIWIPAVIGWSPCGWSQGLCCCMLSCVKDYSSSKLIFGSGTKLDVGSCKLEQLVICASITGSLMLVQII